MTSAITVRSVADALEDAARWRAEEDTRQSKQRRDVDEQLNDLRASIDKMQEQLTALETFKDGLGAQQGILDGEQILRTHEGIFAALEEQRDVLAERADEITRSEAERMAMVEEVLSGSDLADQLVEYNQFKSAVEPSLAQMPESYRSVVMGHHNKVVDSLRQRMHSMLGEPVHADGGTVQLEVVYAVDAPEGEPELLVVVTPIDVAAHEEWADRAESLQLRLAARVVQAVYQACHTSGLQGVEVMAGGHRGLLALEVDLSGAGSQFGVAVEERLQAVLHKAAELEAANVSVTIRQVEADHLLPPNESMGEESDDA
jgi:hypothetical protein